MRATVGVLAILLVSILFLASTLWAQSPSSDSSPQPPSVNLSSAIAPLLLTNDSSSLSAAPLSNGQWGYLVYLNGSPSAFIVVSPAFLGGYDARLLQSVDDLRPALALYYQQAGAHDQAAYLIWMAHEQMVHFNDSRSRLLASRENRPGQLGGEDECRRLMGLADRPCTDYATCLAACFASTTYCQPIAINLGPAFIAQLGAYQNETANLTAAFAQQESAYAAADSDPTLTKITHYSQSIQSVVRAESVVANHPFIGWLCPLPPYDNASILSAQQNLQLARLTLQPASGDGNLAERLANATAWRLAEHQRLAQQANAPAPGGAYIIPGLSFLDAKQLNGLIGPLAIGIVIALVLLGIVVWWWLRRKKPTASAKTSAPPSAPPAKARAPSKK